jgi:hypothetical protein
MIPTSFRLARYRFAVTAGDPIRLPPFKGSALRGGFGHAFKSMVCFQPAIRSCAECLLRYTCPYSFVFETHVPPEADVLSKNENIPRPLVIEPPLDGRTDYSPGETLTFHITLVGRAMDLLPYFLVAFQEVGRRGLGRERGRFHLSRVEAVGPFGGTRELVYDETNPAHIHGCALPADRAAIQERADRLPARQLTVSFLTPTRLKHGGRWVREGPPFHVLVKALLGRVSSLSYFHCGERWDTDFRGWIDRARAVHLADAGTGWVDWERYSGRQQQRVRMGGLVGRVTYEGDLKPFLPLLALGERVHVGKGTVFGNGWYEIEAGQEPTIEDAEA